MKIIIAPDSFKNALRAPAVAAALATGLRRRLPGAEIVELPLADGGEGTAEAFAACTGGRMVECDSLDPLMRPVHASFAVTGDGETAVVELASASGLELLADGERSAWRATTYGTGLLIRRALREPGIRRLIVGLGGSATNDGGAGLLQGLGMKFYDSAGVEFPPGISGRDLSRVARVESMPHFDSITLEIACDVRNPLTGERGASRVFGPQKGASEREVEALEAALAHFARLLHDAGSEPGDGAAGGAGFAMRKLGGVMKSGAKLLLEQAHFARHLAGAALVLTGEGRSDAQTAEGKLCMTVAEAARAQGVPCVLISGAVADASLLTDCFAAVMSIALGPGSVADAIARTRENLEFAGVAAGALLAAGSAREKTDC